MENEKKIEDKFLPIGSVVMLKGGTKPIMITSFCIFPIGKVYNKFGEVNTAGIHSYDYGAVFYPEGYVRTDRTFAFNHEQIDKVLFKGLETEKHKVYSNELNKMMVGLQEQFKIADEEKTKFKVNVAIPEAEGY